MSESVPQACHEGMSRLGHLQRGDAFQTFKLSADVHLRRQADAKMAKCPFALGPPPAVRRILDMQLFFFLLFLFIFVE
jgi:hypothetical protein